MIFFFALMKAIRLAYLTLRAAAGILILGHGIQVWVKNKQA